MYKKWHHFKEHPAQIFSTWGAMASKNRGDTTEAHPRSEKCAWVFTGKDWKIHKRQNQRSFSSQTILYSFSLSMYFLYVHMYVTSTIHGHMTYMILFHVHDGTEKWLVAIQYKMYDSEK